MTFPSVEFSFATGDSRCRTNKNARSKARDGHKNQNYNQFSKTTGIIGKCAFRKYCLHQLRRHSPSRLGFRLSRGGHFDCWNGQARHSW